MAIDSLWEWVRAIRIHLHSIYGSFFMSTWTLLHSLDSGSEKWFIFRDWARLIILLEKFPQAHALPYWLHKLVSTLFGSSSILSLGISGFHSDLPTIHEKYVNLASDTSQYHLESSFKILLSLLILGFQIYNKPGCTWQLALSFSTMVMPSHFYHFSKWALLWNIDGWWISGLMHFIHSSMPNFLEPFDLFFHHLLW